MGAGRRGAQSDVKFHPAEERRGKKMCVREGWGDRRGRAREKEGERDNIPQEISSGSVIEFRVVNERKSPRINEELN